MVVDARLEWSEAFLLALGMFFDLLSSIKYLNLEKSFQMSCWW
jgi:hypothetical protein